MFGSAIRKYLYTAQLSSVFKREYQNQSARRKNDVVIICIYH